MAKLDLSGISGIPESTGTPIAPVQAPKQLNLSGIAGIQPTPPEGNPWGRTVKSAIAQHAASGIDAPGWLLRTGLQLSPLRAMTSAVRQSGWEPMDDPNLKFFEPKVAELRKIAQENNWAATNLRPEENNPWVLGVEQGRWGDAARWLGHGVIQNSPSTIAALFTGGLGLLGKAEQAKMVGNLVLGSMAVMASSEAAANAPEGMDPTKKAAHSLAIGGIEYVTERSLGFGKMIDNWGKALTKSYGPRMAKQLVKDTFKTIGSSYATEGGEEWVNAYAQAGADWVFGAKENPFEGIHGQAFSAAVLGGFSGAMAGAGIGAAHYGMTMPNIQRMTLAEPGVLEKVNRITELKAKPTRTADEDIELAQLKQYQDTSSDYNEWVVHKAKQAIEKHQDTMLKMKLKVGEFSQEFLNKNPDMVSPAGKLDIPNIYDENIAKALYRVRGDKMGPIDMNKVFELQPGLFEKILTGTSPTELFYVITPDPNNKDRYVYFGQDNLAADDVARIVKDIFPATDPAGSDESKMAKLRLQSPQGQNRVMMDVPRMEAALAPIYDAMNIITKDWSAKTYPADWLESVKKKKAQKIYEARLKTGEQGTAESDWAKAKAEVENAYYKANRGPSQTASDVIAGQPTPNATSDIEDLAKEKQAIKDWVDSNNTEGFAASSQETEESRLRNLKRSAMQKILDTLPITWRNRIELVSNFIQAQGHVYDYSLISDARDLNIDPGLVPAVVMLAQKLKIPIKGTTKEDLVKVAVEDYYKRMSVEPKDREIRLAGDNNTLELNEPFRLWKAALNELLVSAGVHSGYDVVTGKPNGIYATPDGVSMAIFVNLMSDVATQGLDRKKPFIIPLNKGILQDTLNYFKQNPGAGNVVRTYDKLTKEKVKGNLVQTAGATPGLTWLHIPLDENADKNSVNTFRLQRVSPKGWCTNSPETAAEKVRRYHNYVLLNEQNVALIGLEIDSKGKIHEATSGIGTTFNIQYKGGPTSIEHLEDIEKLLKTPGVNWDGNYSQDILRAKKYKELGLTNDTWKEKEAEVRRQEYEARQPERDEQRRQEENRWRRNIDLETERDINRILRMNSVRGTPLSPNDQRDLTYSFLKFDYDRLMAELDEAATYHAEARADWEDYEYDDQQDEQDFRWLNVVTEHIGAQLTTLEENEGATDKLHFRAMIDEARGIHDWAGKWKWLMQDEDRAKTWEDRTNHLDLQRPQYDTDQLFDQISREGKNEAEFNRRAAIFRTKDNAWNAAGEIWHAKETEILAKTVPDLLAERMERGYGWSREDILRWENALMAARGELTASGYRYNVYKNIINGVENDPTIAFLEADEDFAAHEYQQMRNDWTNASEDRQTAVDDIQNLRGREVEQIELSKRKGGKVESFHNVTTGKIAIVIDNANVDDVKKLAGHELFHAGVSRIRQELGDSAVNDLYAAFTSAKGELMKAVPGLLGRSGYRTIEELAMDYGFDLKTKDGELSLLMELGARWAERFGDNPANKTWWTTLLTNLKMWFKKYMGISLNENEVNDMMWNITNYGATSDLKTQAQHDKEYGYKAFRYGKRETEMDIKKVVGKDNIRAFFKVPEKQVADVRAIFRPPQDVPDHIWTSMRSAADKVLRMQLHRGGIEGNVLASKGSEVVKGLWERAMVNELGEVVRPYLAQLWAQRSAEKRWDTFNQQKTSSKSIPPKDSKGYKVWDTPTVAKILRTFLGDKRKFRIDWSDKPIIISKADRSFRVVALAQRDKNDPHVRIDQVKLEKDYALYQQGRLVSIDNQKAGIVPIPAGMSTTEFTQFVIQHESAHLALGLDGTFTDENIASYLALCKIGRFDLAGQLEAMVPKNKGKIDLKSMASMERSSVRDVIAHYHEQNPAATQKGTLNLNGINLTTAGTTDLTPERAGAIRLLNLFGMNTRAGDITGKQGKYTSQEELGRAEEDASFREEIKNMSPEELAEYKKSLTAGELRDFNRKMKQSKKFKSVIDKARGVFQDERSKAAVLELMSNEQRQQKERDEIAKEIKAERKAARLKAAEEEVPFEVMADEGPAEKVWDDITIKLDLYTDVVNKILEKHGVEIPPVWDTKAVQNLSKMLGEEVMNKGGVWHGRAANDTEVTNDSIAIPEGTIASEVIEALNKQDAEFVEAVDFHDEGHINILRNKAAMLMLDYFAKRGQTLTKTQAEAIQELAHEFYVEDPKNERIKELFSKLPRSIAGGAAELILDTIPRKVYEIVENGKSTYTYSDTAVSEYMRKAEREAKAKRDAYFAEVWKANGGLKVMTPELRKEGQRIVKEHMKGVEVYTTKGKMSVSSLVPTPSKEMPSAVQMVEGLQPPKRDYRLTAAPGGTVVENARMAQASDADAAWFSAQPVDWMKKSVAKINLTKDAAMKRVREGFLYTRSIPWNWFEKNYPEKAGATRKFADRLGFMDKPNQDLARKTRNINIFGDNYLSSRNLLKTDITAALEDITKGNYNEATSKIMIDISAQIVSDPNNTDPTDPSSHWWEWRWGTGVDDLTKARYTPWIQENQKLFKLMLMHKHMMDEIHYNFSYTTGADMNVLETRRQAGYFPFNATLSWEEMQKEWAKASPNRIATLSSFQKRKETRTLDEFIALCAESGLKPDFDYASLVSRRIAEGEYRADITALVKDLAQWNMKGDGKMALVFPSKEVKKGELIRSVKDGGWGYQEVGQYLRWMNHKMPSGAEMEAFASPELARELAYLFDGGQYGAVGMAFKTVENVIRQVILYNPFGIMTDILGPAASLMGIPKTLEVAANSFVSAEGKLANTFMGKNTVDMWSSMPKERKKQLIKRGMIVGKEGQYAALQFQLEEAGSYFRQKENKGTWADGIQDVLKFIFMEHLGTNKWLWQVTDEFTMAITDHLSDKYMKKHKLTGEAGREIADYVAISIAQHAIQNLPSRIWSKDMSRILGHCLLAKSYTTAGIRVLTGAIPQLQALAPNRMFKWEYENKQAEKFVTQQMQKLLITNIVGLILMANLLSMMFMRRWAWDNDEGHKFDAALYEDDDGNTVYANIPMFRVSENLIRMIPAVVSKAVGLAYEGDTMKWIQNKFNPAMRELFSQLFGKDSFTGDPIDFPGMTATEWFVNRIQHMVGRVTPSAGPQTGKWKDPAEILLPVLAGIKVQKGKSAFENRIREAEQRIAWSDEKLNRIIKSSEPGSEVWMNAVYERYNTPQGIKDFFKKQASPQAALLNRYRRVIRGGENVEE